ncbi:MAG TPA: hypothetical protein VFJ27_09010 [Terriglobia bacterium]|nr:hypothetical protein [Terriglobia bacterium]
MNRTLIAISTLLLMTSCRLGYGPLQDQSKFVSARLADDRRTVLFSFHRFAYRAATGWRAFPDGGIPDYATDINLLGTYDLQTRKIKILRREKNSQWQPGSGQFTIHSANGPKALISQGGQLRGPFKLGVKYVLLDFKLGEATDVDLKSDLAERGRDSGQIYLVDGDGTLVFVTLSLEEAKDSGAYRSRLVPEIWVRTSGGNYVKAAVSAHYQCTRNGEVIYWEPSTRNFMAFSIANRTTRTATEFKVPDYEDVTQGVILSSDQKGLEFGVKVNGQWKYESLHLESNGLK